MNYKKIVISCFIFTFSLSLWAQNVEVGKWRTHFANTPILSVLDDGNRIYAASSSGLFYVDLRDFTIGRVDKVRGLTGIGITKAGFHKSTGQILVCYGDGDIDIIKGSQIINIPDIKRKNIYGDKTIHSIFFKDKYAYLACGFGIVVLDMSRREIKDSYFIGENSTALPIYDVGVDDKIIYAATEKGIYYAPSKSLNLNDYTSWTLDQSLQASKDQKPFLLLKKIENTFLAALKGDSVSPNDVFYKGYINQSWETWDASSVTAISNVNVQENDFIRIAKSNAGYWEVGVYNLDFTLKYVKKMNFGDLNKIRPGDALIKKETLWIGQGDGALNASEGEGQSNNWFMLAGPSSNSAYSLSHAGNSLLMCAGGLSVSYAPEYNFFQTSKFKDNTWSWYNADIEQFQSIRRATDATSAQEDPFKEGHIFVSSGTDGVLEFQDDRLLNHYTPENSILEYYGGACRINSIAFDYSGNLWISNSGVADAIIVKRTDGSWQGYSIASLFSQEIGKIIVDYWSQKWIIGRGGVLLVFKDDGAQGKVLKVDINRGNTLQASSVYAIVEDDEGHMWIGTERGIRVIYTNAKMFENPIGTTSSVECKTIPFVYDNKVVELLKNEMVTAIAIDGANQKWIGTQSNGVYLVSMDGAKELLHFTTQNSPILSDRILDIAVSKENGEVFIGTDKGLISYRGVATAAPEEKLKTLVFPNPVKPDYQGLITIKNLPFNADVKITDLNGNLIYQTKAAGGQAVWNGYNFKGKRPNSGVLLVFATNEDGTSKLSGKIFFIK